MRIGPHEVGLRPIVIAEIGLNHCGSMERAIEMIHAAKSAGCDIAKFQTFTAIDVCPPDQVWTYRSQGEMVTEHRIDIFKRCELPEAAWPILKAECERQGILFMSTPETPADLALLLKVGIPAVKVASDNATNMPMLRACARSGLPVILSTGMCNLTEVAGAILTQWDGLRAVLVCSSEYPCPPESANLSRITTLRKISASIPVGFSDHTEGTTAAVTAVGLGACIFETHFTLSRDLPGPDHWWAKTPDELGRWARDIRAAEAMMGSGLMAPSAAERAVKAAYQRAVA